MSKRIWHKGPPPHVGWWNASSIRSNTCWSWWNGEFWGKATDPSDSASGASCQAAERTCREPHSIEWTDYYPKNARVPRIDPRSTK